MIYTLYEDLKNNEKYHHQICQEPLMMISEVIYTRKDFYLLDEINNGIEDVKNSGLYDYWEEKSLKKSKARVNQKVSKILNLEHLKGTFGILLVGYLTGLASFIAEKIVMKMF